MKYTFFFKISSMVFLKDSRSLLHRITVFSHKQHTFATRIRPPKLEKLFFLPEKKQAWRHWVCHTVTKAAARMVESCINLLTAIAMRKLIQQRLKQQMGCWVVSDGACDEEITFCLQGCI